MESIFANGTVASAKLPLVAPGSEKWIILINVVYLAFVFKIGPTLMKNRKPFNLKYVLIFYNLGQIVLCTLIFIQAMKLFHIIDDIGCIQELPEAHPHKRYEVLLSYTYFLLKVIDYFDTIFYVLRKSYKQVTFLHVYHHVSMFTAGYIYLRSYGWGGHFVLMGILNTMVHIAMYTYYLISSLRPNVKKSLSWKKHITQLQLVQFIILLVHQMWPLMFHENCAFPSVWNFIGCVQGCAMIFLFGNFYRKTYMRKSDNNGKSSNSNVKID